MRVHLCGVRGSTPAVGSEFAEVGGNTSCVALAHDDESAPRLVLDAGTGLRAVSALMAGESFHGTILLVIFEDVKKYYRRQGYSLEFLG